MWFMAGAYALPVVLLIWFVLGLFLSKIRRRTVMFFIFMGLLVYWLAFIGGCAASFFFEPASYWKGMELDLQHSMSFFNAYVRATDDDHFYRMLILPYLFVGLCFKLSFYVLTTHFNLCFAFFYAIAGFCVYNWAKAAVYARLIRTPSWGFGKVHAGKSRLEQAFAWRDHV
jgi:hypothetical protein